MIETIAILMLLFGVYAFGIFIGKYGHLTIKQFRELKKAREK
jgi:hypothetical protein